MMPEAMLLLLLFGNAPAPEKPCVERNFCVREVPAAAVKDPVALRKLIVDARTRPLPPPECTGCDEGTMCESCDHLVTEALFRLGQLHTDRAAREAVALLLDPRLHWDGGPGLTLGAAITRIGPVALSYLRPHVSESPKAQQIIECIEKKQPCM